MSEATEVITDIQEALTEYGSSIIIKKSVSEVRDAYGVVTTAATATTENTKAFIGRYATSMLLSKLTDDQKQSYELSLRFYTTSVLNKEDYIISFKSSDYNIVIIDSKIFQDETLLYEVLVKK
jgi:hypothetical protein